VGALTSFLSHHLKLTVVPAYGVCKQHCTEHYLEMHTPGLPHPPHLACLNSILHPGGGILYPPPSVSHSPPNHERKPFALVASDSHTETLTPAPKETLCIHTHRPEKRQRGHIANSSSPRRPCFRGNCIKA